MQRWCNDFATSSGWLRISRVLHLCEYQELEGVPDILESWESIFYKYCNELGWITNVTHSRERCRNSKCQVSRNQDNCIHIILPVHIDRLHRTNERSFPGAGTSWLKKYNCMTLLLLNCVLDSCVFQWMDSRQLIILKDALVGGARAEEPLLVLLLSATTHNGTGRGRRQWMVNVWKLKGVVFTAGSATVWNAWSIWTEFEM